MAGKKKAAEEQPKEAKKCACGAADCTCKDKNVETRKIVRSVDAGVFFGNIKEVHGDTVVMTDARNIWYWSGAAGLNEMAVSGVTRPNECKFTVPVSEIILFRVCEIITVTPEAGKILDSVPDWRAAAKDE